LALVIWRYPDGGGAAQKKRLTEIGKPLL